jgi:hypothetical protein
MSGSNGFLPCFSRHKDGHFPITSFYANSIFVGKVEVFLTAIVTSPTTQVLRDKIHPKGGIQPIDPLGNKDDRALCQKLGWQDSKVYRVDYGDNSFRLLFGLDNTDRRCHILALDTNHDTRPQKRKSRK